MLSIQAVRGLPRLRAPGIVPVVVDGYIGKVRMICCVAEWLSAAAVLSRRFLLSRFCCVDVDVTQCSVG